MSGLIFCSQNIVSFHFFLDSKDSYSIVCTQDEKMIFRIISIYSGVTLYLPAWFVEILLNEKIKKIYLRKMFCNFIYMEISALLTAARDKMLVHSHACDLSFLVASVYHAFNIYDVAHCIFSTPFYCLRRACSKTTFFCSSFISTLSLSLSSPFSLCLLFHCWRFNAQPRNNIRLIRLNESQPNTGCLNAET